MLAAVLELEAGALGEIAGRLRDQDFARSSRRDDAGREIAGDSTRSQAMFTSPLRA